LLVTGARVVGAELADGSQLRARQVVIAGGGWAGQLGRSAGSPVELRPTRRHLGVTGPLPLDPGGPVVWSEAINFYHRPEAGGALLCIGDEEDVDPNRRETVAALADDMLTAARRELEGFADTQLTRLWCGLRTLTADGGFCVGPDPERRGLFWVAGLGGHGMTCGLEVGRLAACLLTGGSADAALTAAMAPERLVGQVRI
jgi:D-arginine dehydrogenase